MNLRDIRNDIPQAVKEAAGKYAHNHGFTYISFLEEKDGEIVERTFGSRKYKHGTELKITEVMRRSTCDEKAITKNLILQGCAGYITVFNKEDRYATNRGYSWVVFGHDDYDIWYDWSPAPQMHRIYVNADMLKETKEFKYCGFSCGDVINYLNAYRKNKHIEYFGKHGLPLRTRLMRLCERDKHFRKFAAENADAIFLYGVQAAEYAFKHEVTVEEARRICKKLRTAVKYIPELKKTTLDRIKVLDYCTEKKIGYGSYNDYLKAVLKIGLDRSDTKVIYPNNFKRMHDLRTQEYASIVAKEDAEKRNRLAEDFSKAAEKAKKYETRGEIYTIVVPSTIEQLVQEGETLNHCVGRMGYDKKMAEGKSTIFFFRYTNKLEEPYITVEISLKNKKILQAHGKNNSGPSKDEWTFLYAWVERMKQRKAVRA